MNYQHKGLAAGRWGELSFFEQMANIGSEVERALNWQSKHNSLYSQKAYERALELLGFTMDSAHSLSRLREVARMRETLVDYFSGANEYRSTEKSWREYFSHFAYAARRGR
jgi:hypothetical protein